MEQGKDFYLITDIGSTTTKAILIKNTIKAQILGICNANTTVEEPFNDVRYGLREAITRLEQHTGKKLLKPGSQAPQFDIGDDIAFFTTSSAGGGLQILVIGLTLFDSASSARRAAYGAGGIILDVFALDDNRNAAEQMMAMRNLHPDMILLCGGTDGGAISGVLRLAEILRFARPKPKYATNQKIPTIYAGNKDVQDVIKHMISSEFDLVVLPNLRPSLIQENLKPTQEMIQTLFMENVMERAPGYTWVKKQVHADILPTPLGVLNSLRPITTEGSRNYFAFDVGGATTDVFSYIKGNYQRTVSANLGMSYSAMNVMAESEIEALMKGLPKDFTDSEVRNYLGNKTLFPTYNPSRGREFRIEHALAKQAIRLALVQHQEMHYNTEKIGFLDKLKNDSIDSYEEKFNYEVLEQQYQFFPSEIDVLIGAGGVFAHHQQANQSLAILIDAFDAHGITELWLDKDFLSPHLGVLAKSEPVLARQLLESKCMEKLAVHVRPHYPPKYNKVVMKVDIMEAGLPRTLELRPGSFIVLPGGKQRELRITPLGKVVLGMDDKPKYLKTELMVILDTRAVVDVYSDTMDKALELYAEDSGAGIESITAKSNQEAVEGEFTRTVSLPYKGDILFQPGDRISPDDVVASNRYNPPSLFVVPCFSGLENVDEALIRASLQVGKGDRVDFNTNLRHLPEKPKKSYSKQDFPSPVRGMVELVDYLTGTLIMSEIQDYNTNPVHINIAEKLGCPPRRALRYIKRQVGDFVYQGDLIAQRLESNSGLAPALVLAPSTGVITSIDPKTAVLTIQYRLTPYNFLSHVSGKVSTVEENSSITLNYKGTAWEGILGIGKETHGIFQWVDSPEKLDSMEIAKKVLCLNFAPGISILQYLAEQRIRALVVPGLEQADLVKFMGKELGIVNTGNEDVPYTLLIMNAFAVQSFSYAAQILFARMDQRHCYVQSHTRIRAGVARPSICFTEAM